MDAQSVFDTQPETPRPSKSQSRKARKDAKTKKSGIQPAPLSGRTPIQRDYISALLRDESVFAVGPAGTGKTYIPARVGARALVDGRIDKIVVARVAVSKAKHQLGFLPGKIDAKMRPWLTPIFDGIKAEVGSHTLEQWMMEGRVEIAAFEHLRGRTLGSTQRTLVILDEAQNADYGDLRLFLTRMGEQAQCVVTGDLDQIDIPNSGLAHIIGLAQAHNVPMALIQFREEDVVRSPFVAAWVRAFSADQAGQAGNLDRMPAFLHTPKVRNST